MEDVRWKIPDGKQQGQKVEQRIFKIEVLLNVQILGFEKQLLLLVMFALYESY
jgi:hypothetical protein